MGCRMEYKSKPGVGKLDPKQVRAAVALILVGMGIEIPTTITKEEIKNA